MEEMTYSSLQEQYNSLMGHVRAMEPCLRLLYRDHLLMREQGFKFTFAVDFHEIWSYADPIAKFMQAGRKTKPSAQESLLEKQIARAGLFYGLEPDNCPVLLPPYIIELNDKIAQVRAGLLKRVSQLDSEYVKKLNAIAGEEAVRNALDEFQKRGEISPDLLQQLRPLLEERLSDLLFLISGVAGQGLDIIRDLLSGDSPRVQTTSSRWPEFKTLIQQTMQMPTSKWYHRFSRIRSDPGYTIGNLHDAKAIDLVLALNRHLVQKRELVFIVSDTRTMKRVLTEMPNDYFAETHNNFTWTEAEGICVIVPGQDPIPIFQPIETFYYSILFQADSSENTLKNLKAELERIDRACMLDEQFQGLLAQCRECKDEKERARCQFADTCCEMQRELSEHNQHFAERGNVLLAVNRFPVIKPYWDRVEAQQSVYEQKLTKSTLALIQYLSQPREHLENGLKETEHELLRMMESDLKDVFNLAAKISDSYQKEIGGGLEKYTRTRYWIHFHDEKIATWLKELEQARYTGDVTGTSNAVRQLIDLVFSQDLGSERSLLLAVLLLCCRLHDHTIRLVTRVLHDVEEEYRPEYLYVRALAYLEGRKFAQAIVDCETGIEKYMDDPRFDHLCGLIMGKRLEDESDKCDYSWSAMIQHVRRAHDLAAKNDGDIDLRGTVANNLAYYLCLKNEPGDIREALYFIEECQRIIQSFDKTPEFLHTRGCVFKKLALLETNEEDRQQYSSEALNSLQRSYEVAKDTWVDQRDVDKYEKEFREAERQLASFVAKLDPLQTQQ